MKRWLLMLGGALIALGGGRQAPPADPVRVLPRPLVGDGGVLIDTSAPVPPPLPTEGVINPFDLPPVVMPPRDVDTLARTMWGEARGEGAAGMQAVANVVMNRVRDPRWPNTPHDVCMQPYQFSMWNAGDPNGERARAVTAQRDRLFSGALSVAQHAIDGRLPDITGGANHYFAPGVVLPGWADGMQRTAELGGHRFMRG